MSIPENGYPRAAAVSPRLHIAPSVDSTNKKLLTDAFDDPEGHPHLSVVVTRDQTAGRGRLDRTWVTPPDSALAVSVLLRVDAVPVAERGWIPLVAGAAMTSAVRAQLGDREVGLKWPNDVLVGGLKICGILAEVMPGDPHTVVVGAGVNTRMTAAQLPVPTATSFAALALTADEDQLLGDYLTGLRDAIAALAVGGTTADAAKDEVRELCLTVGAQVSVSLPDDSTLIGVASGIDEDGRLTVEAAGVVHAVSAGDVVHVR
ncbi:biotin--[acetyl-CoA-carboxylase] ligase [Microbacterium sp. NPDC077663]|uniref:biotin--[acetyl-CoA-carboxylase] ligase n=1 Tax=Microbacterium sp. NPDC077663 TaxID=3364189 RepID=UPI0037C6AB5C